MEAKCKFSWFYVVNYDPSPFEISIYIYWYVTFHWLDLVQITSRCPKQDNDDQLLIYKNYIFTSNSFNNLNSISLIA